MRRNRPVRQYFQVERVFKRTLPLDTSRWLRCVSLVRLESIFGRKDCVTSPKSFCVGRLGYVYVEDVPFSQGSILSAACSSRVESLKILLSWKYTIITRLGISFSLIARHATQVENLFYLISILYVDMYNSTFPTDTSFRYTSGWVYALRLKSLCQQRFEREFWKSSKMDWCRGSLSLGNPS